MGSGVVRLRPSIIRRISVGLGFVAVLAAAGLAVAPAAADYTDGVIAANKISMEAAIRIWRRGGWQDDDFLSQIKLGDIYGDERGDNKFYDPVESYVWYYLASVSDRLHQHIEDYYARRVIANDYHRALAEQQKLMLLLNASSASRPATASSTSCRAAARMASSSSANSTRRLTAPTCTDPAANTAKCRSRPRNLRRAGGRLTLGTFLPRACAAGIRIGDAAAARRMMGSPPVPSSCRTTAKRSSISISQTIWVIRWRMNICAGSTSRCVRRTDWARASCRKRPRKRNTGSRLTNFIRRRHRERRSVYR